MSKEQKEQIKKAINELERNKKRLVENIEKQILKFQKNTNKKQIDKLKTKKERINSHFKICGNTIISELSLGFWKIMFSQRYCKNDFWTNKTLNEIFPNYPLNERLDIKVVIFEIEKKMESIRHLRNRIAHHEPIFKLDLQKILDDMNMILKWQSYEYHVWVHELHDVKKLLDDRLCQK